MSDIQDSTASTAASVEKISKYLWVFVIIASIIPPLVYWGSLIAGSAMLESNPQEELVILSYSDFLSFYGGILAAIGTITIGYIAYKQNNILSEQSTVLLSELNRVNRIQKDELQTEYIQHEIKLNEANIEAQKTLRLVHEKALEISKNLLEVEKKRDNPSVIIDRESIECFYADVSVVSDDAEYNQIVLIDSTDIANETKILTPHNDLIAIEFDLINDSNTYIDILNIIGYTVEPQYSITVFPPLGKRYLKYHETRRIRLIIVEQKYDGIGVVSSIVDEGRFVNIRLSLEFLMGFGDNEQVMSYFTIQLNTISDGEGTRLGIGATYGDVHSKYMVDEVKRENGQL